MLNFPSFYLTFFKYGKKYAKSTYFKELLFPFFKNFLYINCALCD